MLKSLLTSLMLYHMVSVTEFYLFSSTSLSFPSIPFFPLLFRSRLLTTNWTAAITSHLTSFCLQFYFFFLFFLHPTATQNITPCWSGPRCTWYLPYMETHWFAQARSIFWAYAVLTWLYVLEHDIFFLWNTPTPFSPSMQNLPIYYDWYQITLM